jgi:hypothetical protein
MPGPDGPTLGKDHFIFSKIWPFLTDKSGRGWRCTYSNVANTDTTVEA